MLNKKYIFLFFFLFCSSTSLTFEKNVRQLNGEIPSITFDKENYTIGDTALITCNNGSYRGCLYEGEGDTITYVKIPLIEGKGNLTITKLSYNLYYSEKCEIPQFATTFSSIKEKAITVSDYENLHKAIQTNSFIILGKDITIPANKTSVDDRLIVKGEVILDLNGHTIDFCSEIGENDKNYFIFVVTNKLTIFDKGNGGTINSTKKYYPINVNGGTLTIYNGTYIGQTSAVQVQSGKAYLKGGVYIDADDEKINNYTINCIDQAYQNGSAQIIVTGGKYHGYDPILNKGENPSFSLVPGGWTSKEINEKDITYFEVIKDINVNSKIQGSKVTLQCSYISNGKPWNGNIFVKAPNETITKLEIDSEDFTYSFYYTSYGNYEIYLTSNSTCKFPEEIEKNPHEAVYPFDVIEINDPFIFVSNEYELIEALTKKEETYIKLGNEITLKEIMRRAITTTVHLDLNGKTISFENNQSLPYPEPNVFYVDGGHLIITGKGTVDGTNAGEYGYAVTVDNGGQVTIEDGTFKGDTTVIYVYKGTALLKGGHYEAKPYQNKYTYTINCYDANYKTGSAKIIITGGEYYNFNPKESKGEPTTANFVPFGFIVDSSEKPKYKVTKKIENISFTQKDDNIFSEDNVSVTLTGLEGLSCENVEYLIIAKEHLYEQFITLNADCKGHFYAKEPGKYELYNTTREFSIGEVIVKDKTFYVNNQCNLRDASINKGYNTIIKLLDNIDITIDDEGFGNFITKKKEVNLNEKKITIPKKMTYNSYAFRLKDENAELTITGEGEIDCRDGGVYGYPVRVDNGGKVIIENGIFRGTTTLVYVTTGTAIIKGGYYQAKEDDGETDLSFTLNCQDKGYIEDTCHIYVYGGTFYRYDPSLSCGDRKDNVCGNFVNENYQVSSEEKNNNKQTQ